MPDDANASPARVNPWRGPHPKLDHSPFVRQRESVPLPGQNDLVPVDNTEAVTWALTAMAKDFFAYPRWLVVVPGTSEVPHHHTAYTHQPGDVDGVDIISPEYRARVDHAEALLRKNQTASILISGGSVDLIKKDWCEAKRGVEYLFAKHGAKWPAGELQKRVMVDPWALHTYCNIRNGQRVATLLGLVECTFVTTRRDGICEDQGRLLEREAMAFWTRRDYRRAIGYPIGDFAVAGRDGDVWDTNGTPGIKFASRGYDSRNYPTAALIEDDNWALGKNQK